MRRSADVTEALLQLETVYLQTPIGLCFHDTDLRYLHVNHRIARINGVERSAHLGRRPSEVLPGDLGLQVETLIQQVMRTGEPVDDIEICAILPAGSEVERHWLASYHPVRLDDGELIGVSTALQEITTHRQVELALAEREAGLQSALQELDNLYSSAPVGLCVIDRGRRILKINRTLADLYGMTPEALLNRQAPELSPQVDRTLETLIEGVFSTGEPVLDAEIAVDLDGGDDALRYADGAPDRNFLVSYIPLAWQDGRLATLSCTFIEITEQKRYEHALYWALKHADAASRSKSEFLANMSHEIRSPLTAILGFTDLLKARLTEPHDQQDLQTIESNGAHLLSLLNDFLDLAKIESGVVDMEFKPVNVASLLDDVYALMSNRALEKNLRFDIRYLSRLPETIITDAVRLRQILINLVSNAIKFTDAGHVQVQVNHVPAVDADEACRVSFAVIDSGIGMDAVQQASLFEPFTQADTSVSRRHQGSGLGLTISRRLARMLGGDIMINSEPGRGSTFSVTINAGVLRDVPLVDPSIRRASAVTSARGVTVKRLQATVVVVDDQRDIRNLVVRLLDRAGVEAIPFSSGTMTLRLLEGLSPESARAAGIDALIIDMQMPGMDGYQTVRQLRDSGVKLPILALTAAALKGERKRCLDAGCNDYLAKPVQGDELIAHLCDLLSCRDSESTIVQPQEAPARQAASPAKSPAISLAGAELSAARPARQPPCDPPPVDAASDAGRSACRPAIPASRRRVLVVDDNEDTLSAFSRLLQLRGYEVTVASAGQAALTLCQNQRFSTIVMDIGLPDLSGFEVARRLRATTDTAPRIIAVSGYPSSIEQPGDEGLFDDWLVKPIKAADLQALMEKPTGGPEGSPAAGCGGSRRPGEPV